MEETLKAATPPQWQPDNKANACYACDAPFTLFNRVRMKKQNRSLVKFPNL